MRSIEEWLGKRDEVELDPAQIQFRAHRAKGCSGCIFEGQWSKVCGAAIEQAKMRYLPDCNDGWQYKVIVRDPRQIQLASL